ncbi:MAG: HAD-IIB family hydrolase [Rhizobacter sp.]|nr:HAD-IIB family hydrolase [Chlorobiales bacterium]
MRRIIFSDIDGTLLNERYELPCPPEELMRQLGETEVVFVSSRTAAEILYLQSRLNFAADFIAENGAMIATANKKLAAHFEVTTQTEIDEHRRYVIPLAAPASITLPQIKDLAAQHQADIEIFQEQSAAAVASQSGYSSDDAARALHRRYSVLLMTRPSARFYAALEAEGFTVAFGGKWTSIVKGSDKGRAVNIYLDARRDSGHEIFESIAIGNDANDAPMLEAAARKFIIRNPVSGYSKALEHIRNAERLTREGHHGWLDMLERLNARESLPFTLNT